MISSKAYVGLLVRIFKEKGLETIVFSPGSRNAPLILAFTSEPAIRCLKVPDERSAAYFALGLAQQTHKPVALACTSGTAALNYGPAIAEAYYQKIPLVVLTADRPPEWVDQGDGQAIRQNHVYANYIKKSFTFPRQGATDKERLRITDIANEAYDISLYPEAGPVHINFPFPEPLYDFTYDPALSVHITRHVTAPAAPGEDQVQQLAEKWNHDTKKMILTGLLPPDNNLKKQLMTLSKDPSVILLTETTSNLNIPGSIHGIDKVVSTITEKEAKAFTPDILITAGGHIVSKMIKAYLRKHRPAEHWHISPSGQEMNTFQSLTRVIPSTPAVFFSRFLTGIHQRSGHFRDIWLQRDERSENRHKQFLGKAPFSDLKVFDILFREIPEDSMVQLANSTPVRYSQLYKINKRISFFSNRGVSGIDGCISTAAGAAYATQHKTYLLTGDIAFFYDRNGLWHEYVSPFFKIILINNGGGGIFRFIEGPDKTGHLDIFEAPHHLSARHVANLFGIQYFRADDETSLVRAINTLANYPETAILEIFTPREKNGIILREYFSNLKK